MPFPFQLPWKKKPSVQTTQPSPLRPLYNKLQLPLTDANFFSNAEIILDILNLAIELNYHKFNPRLIGEQVEWPSNLSLWSDYQCVTFLEHMYFAIIAENTAIGEIFSGGNYTLDGRELPAFNLNFFLRKYDRLYNEINALSNVTREKDHNIIINYDANGNVFPNTSNATMDRLYQYVLLFKKFCQKNFPQHVQRVLEATYKRARGNLPPSDVHFISRMRSELPIAEANLLTSLRKNLPITDVNFSANMFFIFKILNQEIELFYNQRETYFPEIRDAVGKLGIAFHTPEIWRGHPNLWNDLMCHEFLSAAWRHIIIEKTGREISGYLSHANVTLENTIVEKFRGEIVGFRMEKHSGGLDMNSALIKYAPLFAQLNLLSKDDGWHDSSTLSLDYDLKAGNAGNAGNAGKFYEGTRISTIRSALFMVLIFQEFCQKYFPMYVARVFKRAFEKIQLAVAQKQLPP